MKIKQKIQHRRIRKNNEDVRQYLVIRYSGSKEDEWLTADQIPDSSKLVDNIELIRGHDL